MGFVEFDGKRIQSGNNPRVTILKTGLFGINKVCYEQYFKNYEYVVFSYDNERNVIGLRPTHEDTKKTYTIRSSRKGTMVIISATAFLNFFRIKHEVSTAYSIIWNDKEKLVEVDLNQTV